MGPGWATAGRQEGPGQAAAGTRVQRTKAGGERGGGRRGISGWRRRAGPSLSFLWSQVQGRRGSGEGAVGIEA